MGPVLGRIVLVVYMTAVVVVLSASVLSLLTDGAAIAIGSTAPCVRGERR